MYAPLQPEFHDAHVILDARVAAPAEAARIVSNTPLRLIVNPTMDCTGRSPWPWSAILTIYLASVNRSSRILSFLFFSSTELNSLPDLSAVPIAGVQVPICIHLAGIVRPFPITSK
jgi:hypothetical protein